jgi:hypothetical protein
MKHTIDFSHHNSHHKECCTCIKGYPRQCSCSGLIHAETIESETFGLLVVYRCDKCNFVFEVQEEGF